MEPKLRRGQHTIPRAMHINFEMPVGIQNEKPVKNKNRDISGNVTNNRNLRPNVSIVLIAGMADELSQQPVDT